MNLLGKTHAHLKSFPREMWILWMATFLNQLGFIAFPFLLLYLTKHLGFSLAKASFVYVTFGASLMISSFMAGNIIDRIGPEKTLLGALVCGSVVSFLSPEGEQRIAFSVYRLSVNLGMSMGPAIGGFLVAWSFPSIFIINGIGFLSTRSVVGGLLNAKSSFFLSFLWVSFYD